MGPGVVELKDIPYPKLEIDTRHFKLPTERQARKCHHGVILKTILTNICGSDLHMVRGRMPMEGGYMVLGHEITGEVVEVGRDVENLKEGDIVSVPFNVSCGRCDNCKEQKTSTCLHANPVIPGAAYGFFNMGGWMGGQAEYMMVPWADWNLLKFPDKDQAMEKIESLALISDILPTAFHGAVTAGVGTGTSVYIAGAGPVGLACAACCQMLGASCVIVGDLNTSRLEQAAAHGCETIDIRNGPVAEQIASILKKPEVDCAVDCVGFEAKSCDHKLCRERPESALNDCSTVTKATGSIGIPGVYTFADLGAPDAATKMGQLPIMFGAAWNKAQSFHTGQVPVMKYNKQLMNAILWDKIDPAKFVNTQIITLDEAPEKYKEFERGKAVKYLIDAHGRFKR